MRNCIVLGSGRSGTSLAMAILTGNGYFMGDSLYEPRDANPVGFFEDRRVNRINEAILRPVVPYKSWLGKFFYPYKFSYGQRWLSQVPIETNFTVSKKITTQIQEVVSHKPYCLKDPRFSYTLPIWRPYLGKDVAYLVVFRHPSSTVKSIQKEVKKEFYLRELGFDTTYYYGMWELMYQHIFRQMELGGDWKFIHYEQILDKSRVDELAEWLGVKLNMNPINASYYRSAPTTDGISDETVKVYDKLCKLAGYHQT